jgi:hypothetical protein
MKFESPFHISSFIFKEDKIYFYFQEKFKCPYFLSHIQGNCVSVSDIVSFYLEPEYLPYQSIKLWGVNSSPELILTFFNLIKFTTDYLNQWYFESFIFSVSIK